jgi:hypothetical protein
MRSVDLEVADNLREHTIMLSFAMNFSCNSVFLAVCIPAWNASALNPCPRRYFARYSDCCSRLVSKCTLFRVVKDAKQLYLLSRDVDDS